MFMVENDKQNAAVFQSFVPQWLVARVSAQFPDLPASICLWEGNSCFFFPAVGNPLRVGKTLLSPPLLLEMKSHSLFSWSWWSVLCLHCQSKTLSWSAQCAKHKKNTGFPRMGFCVGFTRIYACVSFNLSQFCTFSKCWKCFFLSYVISTTSQTPLASESKLEFSIGLQTLDTLTLKACQYKVAILYSRNLTPERMFTKITMGCIPQCNSSFS